MDELKRTLSIFALLTYSLISGTIPLCAQEQFHVPRIQGEIKLDGLIDEPAWSDIDPLPVIMYEPNFGDEPTERTEILIAYDDDYLYAAGRFYDSEPSLIQAPSKKRDELNLNNDWFGLILDTFNDNENALAFFTTPAGLRLDMTVFNDAQGDFPLNPSWNTYWDVTTVRNEQGWFAEMRIPFSSLRFQEENGRVVMGLTTWRKIAHKNEMAIFPAIRPDWGFWSVFKPSQTREVTFEGIVRKNPIYVAPYILGGYERSYDLNDAETAYLKDDDFEHEAGVDIKYGLTSNLTLDVTVNTDFAQVEADNQQINLTRFSLFFPEKRIFFLERSSNFNFSTGGPNLLFYSRRIGIDTDEEVIVPIYGGARLVGRAGDWDLGLLSMQTASVPNVPSNNFSVARLRRQVINPSSYIGGIVTSRIGDDGTYNEAYGLDGIFHVFGNDYLMINWAQTFSDYLENDPLSLAPSKIRVNLEHRSVKGFGYDLTFITAGEDYDPQMGFELREDYTRIGNSLWYGWICSDESVLNRHQLFLNGYLIRRNFDGSTETVEIEPAWMFITKNGFWGYFEVEGTYESVDEEFDITDEVEVPAGEYEFYGAEANVGTPAAYPLHFEMSTEYGSFYDGLRWIWGISPRWSISSSLELSGHYAFNWVDFEDRGQQLNAHIARLRALYMPTTKFSASAFVQYNSADGEFIGNVRFRYNPSEGRDLYLVYDEGINTDRQRDDPVLPYTINRTVLLKYTHTLKFE